MVPDNSKWILEQHYKSRGTIVTKSKKVLRQAGEMHNIQAPTLQVHLGIFN